MLLPVSWEEADTGEKVNLLLEDMMAHENEPQTS